eukprot:SAG11_NODE_3646_length_2314_cov_8.740406_1_plen_98_part_00
MGKDPNPFSNLGVYPIWAFNLPVPVPSVQNPTNPTKSSTAHLKRHLMPDQFGIAVSGGLSMWATVVEAMLQADPRNVFLSIDLSNCFNAMSRMSRVA